MVSGESPKAPVIVDDLIVTLNGSWNEKDEGDELRCDPLNTKWLLLQHKHIRIAISPMVNVVAES